MAWVISVKNETEGSVEQLLSKAEAWLKREAKHNRRWPMTRFFAEEGRLCITLPETEVMTPAIRAQGIFNQIMREHEWSDLRIRPAKIRLVIEGRIPNMLEEEVPKLRAALIKLCARYELLGPDVTASGNRVRLSVFKYGIGRKVFPIVSRSITAGFEFKYARDFEEYF